MRMFPVLCQVSRKEKVGQWPTEIPWAMLVPHEAQAKWNHDQSLVTLASRGGLSPAEMLAVLDDKPFRAVLVDDNAAVVLLVARVLKYFSENPE